MTEINEFWSADTGTKAALSFSVSKEQLLLLSSSQDCTSLICLNKEYGENSC